MGKFLLLAFRNVFRNRRRTVMTLIMVGGGVTGLLLVGGYFAFMTHGLREEHHQRRPRPHPDLHRRTLQPRRSPRPRHRHRQLASGGRNRHPGSHVRGVAPRIEFYGMALQRRQSPSVFMGSAVDPGRRESLGFFAASGRRQRSRHQSPAARSRRSSAPASPSP